MKKGPKKALIAIAVFAAVILGGTLLKNSGLLKGKVSENGAVEQTDSTSSKPGFLAGLFKSGGGAKKIRVGTNTWAGYASIYGYNRGAKASPDSLFTKNQGIEVELINNDDLPASRDAWKAGAVDVMWSTAGGFSIESGNLLSNNPQVFLQHDYSRGGDLVIGVREINSFRDLKGQKVAVAEDSPSYELFNNLLRAADMNISDIQVIAVDSGAKAAEIFKAGQAKAAVIWAPDDQDCIKAVPGSHVIASTSEATHIIADVWFVKKSFYDENTELVNKLAEGILTANALMNTDGGFRKEAIKYSAQAYNMPEDFFEATVDKVRFATYGDNVNFFNVPGNFTGVKGEELYSNMAGVYKDIGHLKATQPAWRNVSTSSVVRAVKLTGPQHDPEASFTFSKPTAKVENAAAVTTKAATINFASGSAELDATAKSEIDRVFGPVLRQFQGGRIRIAGHTDNTGSAGANTALSKARAQSMVNYIVTTYGFDKNRFDVKGYGPSRPIADNTSEAGKAKNRRAECELLGVQ